MFVHAFMLSRLFLPLKTAHCCATIKARAHVKVKSATLKVLFQQRIFFFSNYLQQKAFNKITVPNDNVEFVLVEIISGLITKHKLVVTQKLPTSFIPVFFYQWMGKPYTSHGNLKEKMAL